MMWVMGEGVVVVVVPFSRAKNRQVGSQTHHYSLLLQFFPIDGQKKEALEVIDLLI